MLDIGKGRTIRTPSEQGSEDSFVSEETEGNFDLFKWGKSKVKKDMLGEDIKSKSTYFSSNMTGGKSTNTDGRNGNPRLRKGSTHIPTVKSEKDSIHKVLKNDPENQRRIRVKRKSTAVAPSSTAYKNEHDDLSPLKNGDNTADLEDGRSRYKGSKSHVVIEEYKGDEIEMLETRSKKHRNKK